MPVTENLDTIKTLEIILKGLAFKIEAYNILTDDTESMDNIKAELDNVKDELDKIEKKLNPQVYGNAKITLQS